MLGKKKQKPRRSPGHFDTLISGKTTVEGDVHFSGGLHVDGTIKGRVVAEEGSDAVVRLSEVGEIVGDVVAPHIIINGKVKGGQDLAARGLPIARSQRDQQGSMLRGPRRAAGTTQGCNAERRRFSRSTRTATHDLRKMAGQQVQQ